MDLMKFSRCWLKGVVVLIAGILLAGCVDPKPVFPGDPLSTEVSQPQIGTGLNPIINVGDTVVVTFNDLTPPIAPVEQAVKEDGRITLIFYKSFQASGKTPGQLEVEIRDAYVTNYFKNMTPTVTIKERFYVVDGEVKNGNRYVYLGRMTVLQAIATAGGFGEFAKRTKVQIIRGKNKPIIIDATKALKDPKENVEIFPNDVIFVPKRLF
jgi:polysaccharide export outer membrane protein